MLRKQVEKIEKRTEKMLAASAPALQADREYAESAKCVSCAAKGLNFEEFYKPVRVNDRILTVDYRPKLSCKKCKKAQPWNNPNS